jgi:CheY-like chemotaxis protein
LLKQPGATLAEVLDQSLRAAGARVTTATNPYEVLAEAARAEHPFRYILLGVDYFGRDDFRLLPLLRREWPEAFLVAYHSSGFEYKGELAELVGADLVLADEKGLAAFLDSLSARPASARQPATGGVAVKAYLARPARTAAGAETPAQAATECAPPKKVPDTVFPEKVPDTVLGGQDAATRLTEDELRLLLGEEDQE